jgi:transposase
MAFKEDVHAQLLNELTSMLDEAETANRIPEFLAAYIDLIDRFMDATDPSGRIALLSDALRPNLYARMVLRESVQLAEEDDRFIELEKSIQRSFHDLKRSLHDDRIEP